MTETSVIEVGEWACFETCPVRTESGTLSVRVGGSSSRPPILFNHSILTSSAIWHRQAELLVAQGHRVVCIDMRGHGASESSLAPYAMDDLVADTVAVLDALAIERVHQVGVSLGGMIATGMGLHHPDRLVSLVICGACADAPAPFVAAWDERILLARNDGMRGLIRQTAYRWFGAGYLASHDSIAEALDECMSQTSVEGFVGCAQAIQSLDYLKSVASIEVPTALVVGARDETLIQPMRDLARLMPRAELAVIDAAGHLPQVDMPEQFDQLLLRHLALSVGSTA